MDPKLVARHKSGRFISKSKQIWINNVTKSNAERSKMILGRGETSGMAEEPPTTRRRLADLDKLGRELWCRKCTIPVSLSDIIEEKRVGLASIFTAKCCKCSALVEACSATKTVRLYDVNLKAAIGMIDAGVGTTHMNTILSALNVPNVSDHLMKRNERMIGPAIEKQAHQSCVEAIKLERSMEMEEASVAVTPAPASTNNNNASEDNQFPLTTAASPGCANNQHPVVTSTPLNHMASTPLNNQESSHEEMHLNTSPVAVGIKASIDAAWQRRGSARAYNSKTSHSSLVGHKSRKVLGYTTRKKGCRKCSKGHDPEDHDCRLNHTKSSKAMEPDMAVQLVCKNSDIDSENVYVSVLIGDDDSSYEAAVRRESTHEMEKWSDTNHATKALTSALYNNGIPQPFHEYFRLMLGNALKQNKGNPEAVRKAILSIAKHAFGNHELCGHWCKGPDHIHKNLPGGKPLKDKPWESKIIQIFSRFANNSAKLAPCASSQANESFNNIVASKHPKSRYYGDSESIDYRVAAAVCQKNLGTKFVIDVNKTLGISPGNETQKFRASKDVKRLKQSAVRKSIQFKRRRQSLKKLTKRKESGVERKEGVTYMSECGLDGMGGFAELPLDHSSKNKCSSSDAVVIFDLETTGFGKKAEICQIAAVPLEGEEVFSCYMMPSRGINVKASEVTHLTVSSGELRLNGNKVTTVTPRLCFSNFIQFLKRQGKSVFLVAHNCFSFDAPQLCQALQEKNMLAELMTVVTGFSDSLPILKEKLPDRKAQKLKFKQGDLAKDLLQIPTDGAHNAEWDVKVLKDIICKVNIFKVDFLKICKSVQDIVNRDIIKQKSSDQLKVLAERFDGKVSAQMQKKLVTWGLTFSKLTEILQERGDAGIKFALSEDVQGKPKVTKSQKIISAIVKQLQLSIDNSKN